MKKLILFFVLFAFIGGAIYWSKTSSQIPSQSANQSGLHFGDQAMGKASDLATVVADPGDSLTPLELNQTDLASTASAPSGDVRQRQQSVMDQITAMIVSMKTRDDVKPTAQKIQALAKANPDLPAAAIMSEISELVVKLEGIVWRCRKLIDPSDFLHMSALFRLRSFNDYDYLYGSHIKALFNFVTGPTQDADQQFTSFTQLFSYLDGPEVGGLLDNAIGGLTAMDRLPEEAFEFEFDRSVITGVSSDIRFIDPSETKKLFIKPYIYTLNFLLSRLRGTLSYLNAYNFDDATAIANRIMTKTAINSVKGRLHLGEMDTAIGITPEMIYGTMLEFPKFLTLQDDQAKAKASLEKAFMMGTHAAYFQLAGYVCGMKYPAAAGRGIPHLDLKKDCLSYAGQGSPEDSVVPQGRRYIFNPNSMAINFKSKYHAFRDRARAYSQSANNQFATIMSDVTGVSIQVNVHSLFSGHRDLKRVLFPNGFQDPEILGRWVDIKSMSKGTAAKTWAWNYEHGRPTSFFDPTFGGFFAANVRSAADVYHNMTTVLYTDALAPFAVFIRVPSPVRFIDLPN